jgi:hypothetical protein
VYTGEDPGSESDIDWEDPFFAAVKRSEAMQLSDSLDQAPTVPLPTTTTEYDIDQHTSDV